MEEAAKYFDQDNPVNLYVIKTWKNKNVKVTKKKFIERIGNGFYFPPEGASYVDSDKSEFFYSFGGGRYTEPRAWTLSDRVFRISLSSEDQTQYPEVQGRMIYMC